MKRYSIVRSDEDPYYGLGSTNSLQRAKKICADHWHDFINFYYRVYDNRKCEYVR